MWDGRKLVLAAIVFVALCRKVSAETRDALDMAPDAVDDQYVGCNEDALQTFIHSGLLKEELNGSEGFHKAWNTERCSKVIPGGLKEHTAALWAYKNGDINFIRALDNAVQKLGGNVSTYENDFHFKSLHFLLMDSMRLNQKKCKTVFDIADNIRTAQKGSNVRFGRFNSAHSSFELLKMETDIDGEVIINVTSCFFVDLGENICSKDTDMALLSPAEEFTVEDVKQVTDDDGTFTMIVLKHLQMTSTHNCYMFSRSPADVSSQWLVLALLVLPFFFFNS